MNKPDWKDAPPWANYLAMNIDEEWYWYKEEPYLDPYFIWHSYGNEQLAGYHEPYNAVETKEKRP